MGTRFIENATVRLILLLMVFTWAFVDASRAAAEQITTEKHEVGLASFFPATSPFSSSRNKNRMNQKKLSRKMEMANMEKYRAFVKRTEKLITLVKNPSKAAESSHKEVLVFWQFGEQIVSEKKQYRNNPAYAVFLMDQLSTELGMDKTSLSEIESLYNLYPLEAGLSLELSFDHYRILMDIEDKTERATYQRLAVEKKWSPKELEEKVKHKPVEKKPREWFRGRFVT